MDQLRTLVARIAALFARPRRDVDLDDELAAHIDLLIHEKMQQGLPHTVARTAALREFGGVVQTRETYRVQRGFPRVEQLLRDLRYAVRQLRRSPGFTLTAVLTLALGLGANTAVFSLLNCVLLRPLPVPQAEDLAVLHYQRNDSASQNNYSFSFPMFRAVEQRHEVFSQIAAFSGRRTLFKSRDSNINIEGVMVSGGFFDALRVEPLLGRTLSLEDDRQGGGPGGFTVVLSEDFWRHQLNAAPDIIGHTITLANAPFTVVGVMPRSFFGADPLSRPDVYVPLWSEPVIDAPFDNIKIGHHSWWIRVIARRLPEVSLEKANAALAAESNAILAQTAPDEKKWVKETQDHHFTLQAIPGSRGYTYLRDAFQKPLVVVFVLCSAMLVLACLNLASLLMARAAARERELATRLAMGASRARLIQQLLVESLLIALLGTTAGMLAAPAVSRILAAMLVGSRDGMVIDTSLDLRVLLFVALSAIVATLVVGLVPALRATSRSLNEQIKSGTQNIHARQRRVAPRVLMGLQVALALILVCGAGLLATSLQRLRHVNLGFEPRNLINVNLEMNKQSRDGDALVAWYRQYAESLAHLPGVDSISYANITPMSGSVWTTTITSALSRNEVDAHMCRVSTGYFATMRIPIFGGRDFQWNDTVASGHKAILNQRAAELLFPGMNAVGQTLKEDKVEYQVIGVVGNIHYESLRDDAPAEAYFPLTQDDGHKPNYTAIVRSSGPAAPLAAAARELAARMAPEIPAPVLTPMMADIDNTIASERMLAMLAVFFALCALLVTAIGLYGTLAYSTARRTSEIGIRMALGAKRAQVVSLIFRENAWIALTGSLAGLVVAWFAARTLTTFLYSTSARDPWVLVASVALLGAIASAASLVPALRAARIEPSTALRAE